MPDHEAKIESKPTPANKFDGREWAGAFGDLGTLIPFVIGYISVVKMDPLGVLFTFGLLLITSGLVYRTPMPIQPMKAIGAAAITQSAFISPNMVWGAGLFTGLFWMLAGLTGTLDFISRFTSKPVVRGIVLGLGLSFMLQGIKMMQKDYLIALLALFLTLLLISSKHIPVMFVLVVFGVGAAIWREPSLFHTLSTIKPDFRLPAFVVQQITWTDFWQGMLILGIAQIPLTLGNAVIAVTAENNRLFPRHPVTEKKVAISQGIMNLISPLWGGVPMCHGAGGMAGHVRFGARTGGSLIILGVILLLTGLFFSGSVLLIFNLIPSSILGVILFFAGLELAVSIRELGDIKSDYYVLMITAGLALWNMGIGFVAGILVQELLKRKIIKL